MLRTNLYNNGSRWLDENATYWDRNGERMTEESKEEMKRQAEEAWMNSEYEDIPTAYFLIFSVYGETEAEQFVQEQIEAGWLTENTEEAA